MGWCLISYSISSTIFNNHSIISGSQDLRAPDDRLMRTVHPSIVETLPEEFPDLKHEFSKLESQMFDRYWLTSECKNCQNRSIANVLLINFSFFRPKRPGLVPLTPVLPDANDRVLTPGFAYSPVHTEIYGTYRTMAKQGK